MLGQYVCQGLYDSSIYDIPSESIDRHLDDCPWCQRVIVELADQYTGRLVMAIARDEESPDQDCPNADDLWEFVFKIVSPNLKQRIEEHILQCPQCAQAVTWFEMQFVGRHR